MPRFETTRPVRHSPETMFNLVADIARYPEFVPMCEALHIRRRNEAEGVVTLLADMTIGYKMIRETFTTRVELDPAASQIRVAYVDGPFKHLENRWSFLARPDGGSNVKFFIDYEFRSRTFQMLAGAVFEKVFRKMAEAFEARADTLARTSG
ncbi:MAG TPA: type II toxin-antitoxin system RatA family toxin [Rhabdaerophilum sp.]|nr:type II toxin-antitoxin system RatA family toxin [Rhabdaerophilum sp.]